MGSSADRDWSTWKYAFWAFLILAVAAIIWAFWYKRLIDPQVKAAAVTIWGTAIAAGTGVLGALLGAHLGAKAAREQAKDAMNHERRRSLAEQLARGEDPMYDALWGETCSWVQSMCTLRTRRPDDPNVHAELLRLTMLLHSLVGAPDELREKYSRFNESAMDLVFCLWKEPVQGALDGEHLNLQLLAKDRRNEILALQKVTIRAAHEFLRMLNTNRQRRKMELVGRQESPGDLPPGTG